MREATLRKAGELASISEPVSSRTNGGMQCNGKEPFDCAGVRQVHPSQGRNFPKHFSAGKFLALALKVQVKSTGLFTPNPGFCMTWM
jgi:hypothetical protein